MIGSRAITPLHGPFVRTVRPPGSKSETIRALVVAALADGSSTLSQPLVSDDTGFARQALEQLGVEIDVGDDAWVVHGSSGSLHHSVAPLDAGASGLTARAMIALITLVDGPTTVVGRDRLPERPMAGLVEALRGLGVEVTDHEGRLPVTVHGTGALPGGTAEVDSHQTTQFATALLMAAPLATHPLLVIPHGLKGSHRYLDITMATMSEFGARVESHGEGYWVSPTGYTATEVAIEPDASAAVYPMVAAAITGGRVTIEGLGSRSVQPDMVVARVLKTMGCAVEQGVASTTIDARGRNLEPVDDDMSGSPDGALAVAVAALFASGPSRLRGLGSLRFKESDRLSALAEEINRLGAHARIDGTDLLISPADLRPTLIETHGDHRIAMSFALIGLTMPGIEIADPEVVAKTWPEYWDVLEGLAEADA